VSRGGIAFAVAFGVLVPAAGTSASAVANGLPIRSASLSQQGQSLVWYVQLRQPFSPASLERDHASLCLLIERPVGGTVSERLCVVPGRHRRPPPRLALEGHRTIAATVTRASSDSLRASFLPAAVGLRYTRLRWQVEWNVAGSACSGACTSQFPSRPKLLKLRTPKLVGCVASGPDWVFHGLSSGRMIALTFDDGPWYDTPQFLGLLERDHVVATFFQIGDQIAQYGQRGAIERRMLRDGDMIGNHTWSHRDVAGDGPFAAAQIGMAGGAIRRATGGFSPCLFRAPYGAVSPALLSEARRMGFTTIQWDIDPRDWARPGVAEIETNVIDNAHPGAIVEMHDGGGNRSETLAALPTIIASLRHRGYRFVTVDQMLEYRLTYT
jgi:peptidoglycan/xylan/chitin deacetylase (PgdA/CDA1 family)